MAVLIGDGGDIRKYARLWMLEQHFYAYGGADGPSEN
jgi:hypothetical protein